MMRITALGCRTSRCECGAQVNKGSASCVKCSARHRWIRRKSWRKFSGE